MTYYNRLKSGVESHYVCPDISVFLHVFSMNKHCTASIATELVFQWLTLQCLSFHMIFHGLLIATHNVNDIEAYSSDYNVKRQNDKYSKELRSDLFGNSNFNHFFARRQHLRRPTLTWC